MRLKFIPLILAALPMLATSGTEPSLNNKQKQEVKDLIAETLKSDPKIIINSIVNFRKQQMLKYQKTAEKNISRFTSEIYDQNNELVLGNPKAATTIVEFIDYNCGHCKELTKTLAALTKSNKDVKIIVKDLPIFGESSMTAAKATLAAAKQNKFPAFHYATISEKTQPSTASMEALASTLGLDLKQFRQDLSSKDSEAYMQKNIKLAKSLKIMATPAMIIGTKEKNVFVAGAVPLAKIQEIINQTK